MMSGYITVDPVSHREIFYWFIPSQVDPDNAPLVLWFTGGPGCSGLDALLNENGPLRMDPSTGGLRPNDWSWNRVANVLWLEQPAGVGYSYSENPADYNTSDTKAAADNYVFLKNWLEEFPQFKGRSTWITGESYAGTYVPTLVYNIVSGDDSQLTEQLSGFMLGNPVIFCESFGLNRNNYYILQFNKYFYSGLFSFDIYEKWVSSGCNTDVTNECLNMFQDAENEIGVITQQLKHNRALDVMYTAQPDVDTDDLFQDFCTGNGTLDTTLSADIQCHPLGDLTQAYMNRADVQAALHARAGTNWQVCTNVLNYDSNLSNEGMIPFLQKIVALKPSLHILYYSGDVDVATVPMQVTQACLAELHGSRTSAWQPWRINGWHAGYVEIFDTYTFASIKGAGHEAPQYQPAIAFNMFSRFLANQSLADNGQRVFIPSQVKQGDIVKEFRFSPN